MRILTVMEYKDYYKILGLEKTVGKEELKKQYRKLARKYHPDVNTTDKNAASKFAGISEAYEVLSDDVKRKKYDELGSDWEQYDTTGRNGQFDWSKYTNRGNGQEPKNDQNWEDFFGDFFGRDFRGKAGASFARTGGDIHAELAISLEQAFAGGAETLSLENQNIRITLKPGIWDRQTIRIHGKGQAGTNGGGAGDLFITFALQPHASYRLDGINLHTDIPVSIYSAVLGATQEVKTVSGTYKIVIPPETRNGTVFKLKGRGFPEYDAPGRQGDLFLTVVLQLPEKLEPREIALFTELAAMRSGGAGGKTQ